jgi:hypothetical protein
MKCEICKSNIGIVFLEKVNGTFVKDEKGKQHLICAECQKKFPSKDDVLTNL